MANSAAILRFPEMHLDMVRAGIILYGLHPSGATRDCGIDLRPAMSLKARITNVKEVEEGASISYGRTYRTDGRRKIATISIGYADGYLRLLSNRAEAVIHGRLCPIRGRICMDQCMADVTEMDTPVCVGDTVTLFGDGENVPVTAGALAELIGTIHYELICLIGKRVPRIYIKNGQVCHALNFLLRGEEDNTL